MDTERRLISKTIMFVFFLLILVGTACQTNDTEKTINDLQVNYGNKGYIGNSEDSTIAWKHENYFVDVPAKNLAVRFYPSNKSSFISNPYSNKELIKAISIANQYLGKVAKVDASNTSINEEFGLLRYGFKTDDMLCLVSTPVSYLFNDNRGNGYVDITIGCATQDDFKIEDSQIRDIYNDVVSNMDSSVLKINKEVDGKFFHLNARSIYGGGAELIVVKKNNRYLQIYGGNSGIIPCNKMHEFSVPESIYGECYDGMDYY